MPRALAVSADSSQVGNGGYSHRHNVKKPTHVRVPRPAGQSQPPHGLRRQRGNQFRGSVPVDGIEGAARRVVVQVLREDAGPQQPRHRLVLEKPGRFSIRLDENH